MNSLMDETTNRVVLFRGSEVAILTRFHLLVETLVELGGVTVTRGSLER